MDRRHLAWGVRLVALIACGAQAFAEDPAATPQTLQGEIVDPAAYLKASQRGAEATEQTYEAVDGGQTLALLEEGSQMLYLLLAEESGEDPNELAYDFVNQQVRVQGAVHERGGMRGIVVTAIEPLESAEPVEAAEAAPSTVY